MTNNENWHGNRKSGTGAGRDGKPYEKRDVKSILKGTRGAPKNFSPNSNEGSERPFRPDFNKRNENRTPYEQKGSYYTSNDRKPYENKDNRPSYHDRPHGDMRPRFKPKTDGNTYPDSGNTFRPPFKSSNERYSKPDYGNESRPRFKSTPARTFSNDGNSSSRQRFTVNKPGGNQSTTANYIETRFDHDDSNRRPRIKRSGNIDPHAKYSKKKQLEYKKSEVDFSKPVRLNKFLANAGICSRREADDFIKAGVITVNGEIVSEMGVKVMHSDKIMFHSQLVRSEKKVYILLNKPKDTVTTSEDTHDRRTVMDLVKNACSERIYPVGRLDRNTTGVLLLTNDGDLASRLTHPKYDKKKIYHVVLDKPLAIADFESIIAGVVLDDEKIAADSLNFIKEDDLKHLGIEIHSGQNRVVRRIFDKLGYKVVRLDRVYFAGLTKKNLPRGKYRFLSEREVSMLKMGAYE